MSLGRKTPRYVNGLGLHPSFHGIKEKPKSRRYVAKEVVTIPFPTEIDLGNILPADLEETEYRLAGIAAMRKSLADGHCNTPVVPNFRRRYGQS